MTDFAKKLEEALQGALPGKRAHYEMARSLRHGQRPVPTTAVPAGVLALFSNLSGAEWQLTYIRRTSRAVDDRHSGQISFPGGKVEAGDRDLAHTALRETEEEIGVSPGSVRLLGKLSELYIPVSNFLVHPYVGILEKEEKFRREEKEVEEILQVGLNTLLDPSNIKQTDMQIRMGYTLRQVPYYDLDGQQLWGATAMITNELIALLRKTGLQERM